MPTYVTVRDAVRNAATTPAPLIHHAFRALELVGITPTQAAKEAVPGGVSKQQWNTWKTGKRPPPFKHYNTIYNYAAQAVVAAVDVIGETAKEHPELVSTHGFSNYCRRIALAKDLLLELEADLRKQQRTQGGKSDDE